MWSNEDIDRLREEYASLILLERRSRFIKVKPVDVSPGLPPNKYVVTYTCKGIRGIGQNNEPLPSEEHAVEIYLDHNFPTSEPSLTWLTPIWHPNIEHNPPHAVCTDNIKSWYPTRSLDTLVIALGEMIQYKKYHAKWESPYPIDHKVATWVLEYAEKRGYVSKEKPFDKRPLIRPLLDPHKKKKRPIGRISLPDPPAPAAPAKHRVKIKF